MEKCAKKISSGYAEKTSLIHTLNWESVCYQLTTAKFGNLHWKDCADSCLSDHITQILIAEKFLWITMSDTTIFFGTKLQ